MGAAPGFAYAASLLTSVRGGYSVGYVHFARAGPGVLLPINAPQAVSASVTQTLSTIGFRRLQEGFPNGLTDTFDPLKTTVISISPNTRDPYVQSYYVAVQRGLAKNSSWISRMWVTTP